MRDPYGAEVLPGYEDGHGLANVVPTLLDLLAGSGDPLPPLAADVLPRGFRDGARAVLLLLVDGLGYDQLRRAVKLGHAPNLARLAAGDAPSPSLRVSLAPITSVFPSTTVAALTTLHTGAVPHRHGMLGYELYLPRFGQVSEMIRWGPASRPGSYADPELGGADPASFLEVETAYQRLARAGVATRAVLPARFRGTPLTRMMFRGTEMVPYDDLPGLFQGVNAALAATAGGPAYVYAYWGTLDLVAHEHGPLGPEHAAALGAFDAALGAWLAATPPPPDTLVLLTADHGHVATDPAEAILLNDHHDLLEHLSQPPAGERRARYLYVKPGRKAAVREYVRTYLRDVVSVLDGAEALERGLFGPGEPSAEARARVGDLILLPRGGGQIHYAYTEGQLGNLMRGCHGGLAREEMLVPLLALRR